jgi:IPT/TIG domain
MSTPDYGTFEVANALLPLPSPGTNTLLRDADPALYYALDFWSSMITTYVGPRLLAAAASAGVTQITSAVQQQYPYDPAPYMTEGQFQFPLLAIYRKTGKTKKLTASYEDDNAQIGVAYILPPLTAAQAEQVAPIFSAIYKTLRNRTTQGWDPNYTPPGGSGPTPGPWTSGFANIEEVGFTGWTQGAMPGGQNMFFPALVMDGYIIERDNYVTGYASKFLGGDITTNLVANDGTSVANITQASTQQAPTITSLSVSSGTMSGGTSVTITGTNFIVGTNMGATNAPGSVLFGGLPATSVAFASPTSITCVSPAVSGSGVVSVTVNNFDGQSATLSAAFTYTSP